MINLIFSELLCSKICHDLAGSVGTIRNALEILNSSEANTQQDKVLALLLSSSEQALNSIAYFKTAYGYALGDNMHLRVVEDLVHTFFSHFTFDVRFIYSHQTLAPAIVKLILNVLIILKSLIVINGTGSSITVDINTDEQLTPTIVITAKAVNYRKDLELVQILHGCGMDKIYPTLHTVQQFYTYYVARDASYQVSLVYATGEIRVSLWWLRVFA